MYVNLRLQIADGEESALAEYHAKQILKLSKPNCGGYLHFLYRPTLSDKSPRQLDDRSRRISDDYQQVSRLFE